jgi:putative transposase
VVSPAQKKRACAYLKNKYRLSERLSGAYLSLCRSTQRYFPKENDDEYWKERIRKLARRYPRFGYRRITELLKQQGFVINRKKVYRLWQLLAMQVKPRKRRRRKLKVDFHPIQAKYPNHVWSYDFIHDRIAEGPQLKILVILDEFTREIIAIEVGLNIGSERVKKVLTRAFLEYGMPEYIRSDNGPEFLAVALREWLKKGKIGPVYIVR